MPCSLLLRKTASLLTRLAPLISPSFSSITFQNFPATSDLRNILSEVSNFRHHTKLCSECTASLVSALKFKPHLLMKILLVECYFCHGNPGLNFTCTTCIICYHATQTAEIFPIFQLFFIYPNGHSGWLRCDSHCLRLYTFISTPEQLPISISLATMSCSTVSSLASRTVQSKGTVHPRTGHIGPEGA